MIVELNEQEIMIAIQYYLAFKLHSEKSSPDSWSVLIHFRGKTAEATYSAVPTLTDRVTP